MENKEETILETEEKTDTAVEEVIVNETIEEEKAEYPKTVSVNAYGQVVEMTLDESGIKAGDLAIKMEDILLVNRYINMKNLKNEPTFTVVYKIDESTVTKFDFVQNTELTDFDFDDKVAFWLKNEEINFEENDWNFFCPIINGYLTYKFAEVHKETEQPRTINALALGGAIAGVLITIFGGVMFGLGKTLFGATGLGLGIISIFISIFNLIKKK